jgi:predicted alpha/beta hydrolase
MGYLTPVIREPFEIVCADGWRLRGEVVAPERPRAAALVGHAMMVDRRTLDRPRGRGLVSHLASSGVACVWFDLRGHGQSGPLPHEGGDWSYDDLVDHDVPALVAFARARFPSLPLAAVGHSLFAHVALARLLRHPETPVDRLVLLAANVPQPIWQGVAKPVLIELMGAITRVAGRLPVRRLGAGSDDEARGYIADFTRMKRAHRWHARDGFQFLDARPSLRRPVLALVGAGDRLYAPPEEARALVRPLAGPVDFRIVGRPSLPFDPGHMSLVLDERARPAWDLVADFITR